MSHQQSLPFDKRIMQYNLESGTSTSCPHTGRQCNTSELQYLWEPPIPTGLLMPWKSAIMTDWLVVLLLTPALSICDGCCWENFLQGWHGDDHHKQFQKEIIPLFAEGSIMFSVEECLFVSHYCLLFWFSATKHLGHPIRDGSAVMAIKFNCGPGEINPNTAADADVVHDVSICDYKLFLSGLGCNTS
jgi:hypothetical protein